MSHKMIRRILEGARKVEDSELQLYATEPPGAMGEQGQVPLDEIGPGDAVATLARWLPTVKHGPNVPGEDQKHAVGFAQNVVSAARKVLGEPEGEGRGREYIEMAYEALIDAARDGTDAGSAWVKKYGDDIHSLVFEVYMQSGGPTEEMEFTIDEDSPLDENEWMTLDEMDLTCEACAAKMRERKMTRIKRSEAQECADRYGKKKPDEE